MKVVTAAQMREIDSWAINALGIPGHVLMENAGRCVASVAASTRGDLAGARAAVVCGKGNNGGDGFVVARQLCNMGSRATAYVVGGRDGVKGDALLNLNILERMAQVRMGDGLSVVDLVDSEAVARRLSAELPSYDLIVDALLGTGFSGTPREPVASAIEAINGAAARGRRGPRPLVVAVDVPSGLDSTTGLADGPCVSADVTVTFAYPKLGLVVFPGAERAGDVLVGDIGIPDGGPALDVRVETIEPRAVASWLGRRRPDSHKGTYGRVLVVAGSSGMTGAAAMVAEAACRAGAGLVTAGVPCSLAPIIEAKLTEAMKLALPEAVEQREGAPPRVTLSASAAAAIVEFCRAASALAYGPGISVTAETRRLTGDLLASVEAPIVLDADGLNCLDGAKDLEFRAAAGRKTVITPHPGEMGRLCGTSTAEVQRDRVGVAAGFARASGAVVVLKGARTIVASPDGRVFINMTGNAGMATGGMGDVLTGEIAGLIAQGLEPFEAAAAGAFLHGLAGDIAAADSGEAGFLAGDVSRNLPAARAITCGMDDAGRVVYQLDGASDIYLSRVNVAVLAQRRYNPR